MTRIPIHLVSDSTGETVALVGRACLVQFDHVEPEEHLWSLVRTKEKVQEILSSVEEEGGVVIYTMADQEIRRELEEGCAVLQIPCIPVLDPIIGALGQYLGTRGHARPGSQHVMNAEYFSRIEAMQFALTHDDGQSSWDLNEADVVLLGVSRTSKTPTCIYLANRGIKTANVPIVPGCPIPKEVFEIMVESGDNPKKIIESKGMKQQSDPKELEKMINEILSKNKDKVDQYKAGKEKLFGFFVGQVMKATQGKANPGMVNQLLKDKLS